MEWVLIIFIAMTVILFAVDFIENRDNKPILEKKLKEDASFIGSILLFSLLATIALVLITVVFFSLFVLIV